MNIAIPLLSISTPTQKACGITGRSSYFNTSLSLGPRPNQFPLRMLRRRQHHSYGSIPGSPITLQDVNIIPECQKAQNPHIHYLANAVLPVVPLT